MELKKMKQILLIICLLASHFVGAQNENYQHPLVEELFANLSEIFPNFPKTEGLSKQKLDSIENLYHVKLPLSVKAFYQKIKEDNFGLGYGWFFESLNYKATNYIPPSYVSCYTDFPERIKIGGDFKKRVRIISDGGGSQIYLDFDPNEKGKEGQLILIFRDYPEIIFLIADDFDDFLGILNESINSKKTELIDNHYLQFRTGGYSDFLTLNNRFRIKKTDNNQPLKLSSTWEKSISFGNGEFLGKKSKDLVINDLERIYYLNIYDDNLKKLDTLALFSNIAKVSIYSNDLIIPSSFWDILSKTNLAIVEITSKKDIDISGLLKLKHLTHLELSAPHIINQDQITELTNLKVLKITETDIQDLRFLEKIPQLSELYLGNFWGVSNKEPKKYTNFHYLEKLPFLESLDLSNSNFSELKYLTKLPKLQQLIVNNCPIVDYKNIQNFKKPLSISCDGLFFEKTIDFVKKSKVQHNYGALSGLSETQKKQYDEWIISKDKED